MIKRDTIAHQLMAIIIAGATVAVLLLQSNAKKGRRNDEPLLGFDVKNVNFIRVETGHSIVELSKTNDAWTISKPYSMRASSEHVQRFLDKLESSWRTDVISEEDQVRRNATRETYGLGDAAITVTLDGHDMPRTEMLVGEKSYVAFSGQNNDVIGTDTPIIESIPRHYADWRDKSMIPGTIDSIMKIEIRRQGQNQPTILEKISYDRWMIRQPQARRASTDAIAKTIQNAAEGKIEDIVNPNGDASSAIAHGCTPEDCQLIFRYWLSNGARSASSQEIIFGDNLPSSEGSPPLTYALVKDENIIALVPQTMVASLDVDSETFRDKRIWTFGPDDISEISMRDSEQSVAISRQTNGEWIVTRPITAPADSDNCWRFARSLYSLEDSAVADVGPDSIPQTGMTIITQLKGGSETNAASAWKRTDEFGKVESLSIYTPDDSLLHTVDGGAIPEGFNTERFFASLRSREVVAVGTNAIESISILDAGAPEPLRLNRSATDASWLEPNAAVPIANALSNLVAQTVYALAPESLEEFGVEKPARAITISCATPAPSQKTLLIGKESPLGSRFAMVKGGDSVFVLSEADAVVLMRKPEPKTDAQTMDEEL